MAQTETVQTISKDELSRKLRQGEPVQVVNVLDPKWYTLGFIQGSKKIPLAELDQRIGELDRSKEVVTYCAGADCSASSEAAKRLAAKGFNVKAYEGGIKEWTASGLPTEGAAPTLHGKSSCC